MAYDNQPGAISRRSMLRAGLLGATLLGSGVPLLSACGSGDQGSGDAKELVFWNFYGPNPDGNAQSKWFEDLAAKWNANNDVKIKLHYLPVSEYLGGTALQTAFSSGAGPDIFIISPGDFLRYYNGGVLTDLTPHLGAGAKDDFVDGVLDTRTVEGKVFGLPMEIEPLAMYYSTDAFEKAGLSEGDLPKTWDQLLDVGRKLTDDKRFGLLFETAPGYYQNFTWYPFMWQGGAAAVGPDGKSGFNSDAVHKALGLWGDAVKNGIAPKKTQGDGGGNAVANLASGFCAMQQTGIWSVSQLETDAKDFRYGVFPLPTPTGGTYTTDMGGWAFCANAKGGNPQAAAKFIAWALGSTDAEGVERMRQWNTVVKTNMPSRKSVKEAATKAGAFEKPALKTFMEQVVPGGRAEPRYTPEVYKAISDAIQATMLGGAVPATAAADAAGKIDAFLSGYKGAAIL
ncbi:sugar ABC transporter substrate-binding protein [Catellatospora sp. KI3]|uniref:ABC transporter substrate-binding protein n=1 Tax=Catellatospora sp. KI3 TaxID=3041620 RepID=UPI00248237E5|nr:sugar ABC transporter substrate-binding protein [Catellatospora sp. KI3]MDI1463136.1 sugar ABC transporter substrate-binding protein [Catellatospora sp. KI3]